jgi:hypothetical protein
MQSNTIFVLHIILILFLLSFPAWPIKYVHYGIYIPFAISAVWLLFGSCPITHLHEGSDSSETMTHRIYKMVWPDITQSTTSHINVFGLLGITLLGHYRIVSST